jgi:hypothetical protein
MSISAVRCIGYKHDGVSEYQCLNCYERWDSETPPFREDWGGAIWRIWKYCPHCGIEWSQHKSSKREPEDQYEAWQRVETRSFEESEKSPCFVIQRQVTMPDLWPDRPEIANNAPWEDEYGEYHLSSFGAAEVVAEELRIRRAHYSRSARNKDEDDGLVIHYRAVLRKSKRNGGCEIVVGENKKQYIGALKALLEEREEGR